MNNENAEEMRKGESSGHKCEEELLLQIMR